MADMESREWLQSTLKERNTELTTLRADLEVVVVALDEEASSPIWFYNFEPPPTKERKIIGWRCNRCNEKDYEWEMIKHQKNCPLARPGVVKLLKELKDEN